MEAMDQGQKAGPPKPKSRRWSQTVVAAIIGGIFLVIVAVFNRMSEKPPPPPPQQPQTIKVVLSSEWQGIEQAKRAVSVNRKETEIWQRLDSSRQPGFYEEQLTDLEQKLTECHVAPDGVKFMFGIGLDEPHRGWISVFVRRGDEQPFVYKLHNDPNPGEPGSGERAIIEKLASGEVLPIGWTYKSKSFIYATANVSGSSDLTPSP